MASYPMNLFCNATLTELKVANHMTSTHDVSPNVLRTWR